MDNMPTNTPHNTPHIAAGTIKKIIYTTIAVVFLMIGLAGLLVPVIPGILFLLGAVLLMAKVSSRVHHWSEGQAWVRGSHIRLIQMQGLQPLSKIKFALLLGAQSVVSGIQKAAAFSLALGRRLRSKR